jgi:glycosyltransferase involved in cell wall biosynthesis
LEESGSEKALLIIILKDLGKGVIANMQKLTAIVIVKNGEDLISDCLDSLAFADEIVVVDCGSEDHTKELAEKFKAKVYECKFDDFSKIRNFGLEKAEGEWVLYVDVDERVSKELADNIKKVVNNPDNLISAYRILRQNFYLGNNPWPYIEKLERLFNKEKLKRWEGELHESPIVEGKIENLNGLLLHYTHRDLSSMVKKTIEWSQIEAELRFKANHPKMTWWRFPRVMLTAFFNSYIKQKGYKAGTAGIIESIYQSFSMFITYARLWEMQRKRDLKK